MTILDRYLLKSFFAILVLGTLVMALLFLVISVVDSLDWMDTPNEAALPFAAEEDIL